MTLNCVRHVSSLIEPIRAVSMGGAAHDFTCGERLWQRASQAVDSWRRDGGQPRSKAARYGRFMHTSGLVVAAGLHTGARPLFAGLSFFIGTGRHRYTMSEQLAAGRHIAYIEAFVNHPLDTGLLGLISAYNIARDALIAGTLGAAAFTVVGLVLWPFRGLPQGVPICTFVDVWVQRGALFAGAFGALMGSCFIWSPYNYVVVQCLRVITAIPELLVNVLGYVVGAVAIGLTCLLAYDLVVGGIHALAGCWPRQGHHMAV